MYATIDDFVEAFEERETVELTNMEDSTATVINADRLTRALIDASAEIDFYLWRYVLPIDVPPDWFRPCCLDFARYHLYQNAVHEDIRNKYLDWIKKLEMIAKGQPKLSGAKLITDSTIALDHGVKTIRGDRIYSKQTLSNY
jgi:phage gp36-like protein